MIKTYKQEKPVEFDSQDWARRFLANAEEAERNAYMDSGWSPAMANRYDGNSKMLLMELFSQLKGVAVKPEDFGDRPQLAAVLVAIRMVEKWKKTM